MLVPDWYRRFIRGASWGCKVRFSQGVIIDQAVYAEAGATCGSKCGSAEEGSFGATRGGRNRRRWASRNQGDLGKAWAAKPEANRRSNPAIRRGRPDGTELRGDSERKPAGTGGWASGATQTLIVGDTGGAKRRGNLELSQPAPPKERESRRLDDRSPVKPEMRNEGQPEVRIAGEAGGSGSHWGDSEPCVNRHRRRHHKRGETWAEIAGTAEETRKMAQTIGIVRRLSKMGAGKRQLWTETQVEREDQECGQPATWSAGLKGRWMIRSATGLPLENARGRKVSGVFVLWGRVRCHL